MPGSRSLFRLFISSTFSDFVAERDALHRHVFPALDALCREYGARFQAVDLRWGISADAGRERQTLDICLGEVARCQRTTARPNFLILLGDRYGWRPPASRIPAADFADILAVCAPDDRDWLSSAYLRDDNAVPPVFLLRTRDEAAAAGEARTVEVLHRSVARLPWPVERRRPYEVSATELEVLAGAFSPPDAHEHVLCIRRTIAPPPTARAFVDRTAEGLPVPESDALRADLADRLRAHLGPRFIQLDARWRRDALSSTHLGRLPATPAARRRVLASAATPQTVCDAVWRGLAPLVLEQCQERSEPDDLTRETEAHEAFRAARSALVLGRDHLLGDLTARLDTLDSGVLVLEGERGSGKSTVMAALADRLRARAPDAVVIPHFIGATARATSGVSVLAHLTKAMARACGQGTASLEDGNYDEVVRQWLAALDAVPATQAVVILVDALDQLAASDRGRNLAWVPHRVPPHVRVVVSTASPDLAALLRRKLAAESFITVPPLLPATSHALLERWLADAGRRLTGAQADDVRDVAGGSGVPLHLRLLFEDARRWRSFDGLPAGADGRNGLPHTIGGAVDDLLWRLSRPSSHGATLVARSLAYLCSARDGLADDEMLDVLSRDADVMDAFRRQSPKSPHTDRLPDIVWSRLFFDLEPYLAERDAAGGTTWSFFHQQIGELIRERVLAATDAAARHRHLADYFTTLWEGGRSAGPPNRRVLTELPWQLARAAEWTRLVDLVTSWEFLDAQVRASGPAAAMADIDLALEGRSWLHAEDVAALEYLHATLRIAGHVLARDPAQLRAQLFGRVDTPRPPRLATLLDRALASPGVWLCPGPSFWRPGGPVVTTIAAHGSRVTGVVLTKDGQTAVSASEDGTVKVWDVARETERFVLSTGDGPMLSVALSSGGDAVFAASQTGVVCVWDLASGTLRHRWPGLGDGRALALSKDGSTLLSGTGSHELLVVDAETGAMRRTLTLGGSGAAWLAWSDDERRLMVGGVYDSVTVLQMPDARMERELYHGDDRWVSGLAMTADGRTGISGDWDGNLFVWDLETGERRLRLTGYRHNERVTAVALTPDGRFVISASNRARLLVHDITASERGLLGSVRELGTGRHKITHMAVTPDGSRAVSAAEDATIRIWDLTSERSTGLSAEPDPFADDDEGEREVEVGDDSRRTFRMGRPEPPDAVLTVHKGATLQVQVSDPAGTVGPAGAVPVLLEELRHEDDEPADFAVTVGAEREARFLRLGAAVFAAASKDGRWLACLRRDNSLAVWDLTLGVCVSTVPLPAPPPNHLWFGVSSAVVTCDGRFVLGLTDDENLLHVDVKTGRLTVLPEARVPGTLRLAANEESVAGFCRDTRLRIWSAADASELASFAVPDQSDTRFIGDQACWLTQAGRLVRVDLSTRQRRRQPLVKGQTVALLRGGHYIAARSADGVHLWDAGSGRRLVALPVSAAAYALSADVGIAAVAHGDLMLWDVRRRTCLARVSGDAPFVSCRFIADGRIEAGYENGGRHVFAVLGAAQPAG
ncbi:MAG: DUF4062 domain-containing protein [Vicinamibacterales bacterium]